MRLGIFDHFGWAVAVTADADGTVVDRRRLDLVEPGVTPAPIHYDGKRLGVAGTTALVAAVRASVSGATSARERTRCSRARANDSVHPGRKITGSRWRPRSSAAEPARHGGRDTGRMLPRHPFCLCRDD